MRLALPCCVFLLCLVRRVSCHTGFSIGKLSASRLRSSNIRCYDFVEQTVQ